MSISIIVPIYNASLYLRRCLDNIVKQLTDNIELILIDDGSTDDSYDICKEYEKSYNGIKLIRQTNRGVGVARNNGLTNSSGDWVTFLDSDDFLSEDFYKIAEPFLHINRDIIFFNYITEDIDKKNDVSDLSAPIDIEKKDNETLIKNCFLAKSITESSNVNLRSVWGKLIKRSFLISNNIFFDENVKIGEDMIFMLKIYSSLSSAFYVPSVIYHYHFSNPTSITNSFKPDLKIMIDCFNVSIAVWLILNPNYNIYFYNYRLNDLILYFKYDFFHKLNKSPKHNRKRNDKCFWYVHPLGNTQFLLDFTFDF